MLEENWWNSVYTRLEDVQAEKDRLTSELNELRNMLSAETETKDRFVRTNGMIRIWVGWNGHWYRQSLDKETLDCYPDIEQPYIQGMTHSTSHHHLYNSDIWSESFEPLDPEQIDPILQQLYDDCKSVRDIHRLLQSKTQEGMTFDLLCTNWCDLTGHILSDETNIFSED